MRYIVRLVLPVAVLTIITGMLPVLPTDIGGTNQLAQVSDVVGGSGGLLNGNGNTQFEQRLEERQQNLSGGSLNDFQLPGTGGSDPFYYQIVPQVPTTGSSGATSPTGSLGGSNTGTGASPSDTPGSSGATTGSTGGSVIIPRSSGVLPGVNLYQNQAGQIIQEQFRQQQTQVVEANSLPDLLQNSTAAFDLSGCLEECEGIEAQAANECHEKNPKQDRLKSCLDAAYNTKVECQRRCRETAKNQGSGGSSSGAGNSSAAQSLQVWVPETTNLVTLQTGEAGRTPLVLLPSTAANVSLSELPGYVSVNIAPIVLPSSKAIEITQATGAKLQVEDAGSLLDSIAVANDILGREEVRTQSGGTLVIPGAKTTALSAIGRGVVDVSRSIGSVFTNISDFFGALVGDERVLTESPSDSSLSGSVSGCPPPTGGSVPTCSETACRTKTGTGICQLKTENVPGYTNGKIFSVNKGDFAIGESLVATTQVENSCECVNTPSVTPPPVAGEKCLSPKDTRRASANESISASVTISLDPLGLLFDGNECVPEEKCIGEKVTGRDASGNLKTECVNRAVINVCHTVADNKAIARDQAALEAAQDALEAEQEAACNKKIADKVNSILNNAPNLKCQPPAQDGNGKACLGPGVKFSYEVDECAVDSITMTEIKGGDTPQMRITVRGSGSGSSVAEFGCFNGSATPYEAPEPEKPTPPTPPSGGGSSSGGGGSNLNPVSLDDVAIPEPQSLGIADIPEALGSIVREKLFGAFFNISATFTGDDSYEPKDFASPLSPTGKACINLAGTDTNPRLPDNPNSFPRSAVSPLSGYTCGDSRCADGSSCTAFKNQTDGAIGCGCLPSQQNVKPVAPAPTTPEPSEPEIPLPTTPSVPSPSTTGDPGPASAGQPKVDGGQNSDTCVGYSANECSNVGACVRIAADGGKASGRCALFENSVTGERGCKCVVLPPENYPSSPVNPPVEQPAAPENPSTEIYIGGSEECKGSLSEGVSASTFNERFAAWDAAYKAANKSFIQADKQALESAETALKSSFTCSNTKKQCGAGKCAQILVNALNPLIVPHVSCSCESEPSGDGASTGAEEEAPAPLENASPEDVPGVETEADTCRQKSDFELATETFVWAMRNFLRSGTGEKQEPFPSMCTGTCGTSGGTCSETKDGGCACVVDGDTLLPSGELIPIESVDRQCRVAARLAGGKCGGSCTYSFTDPSTGEDVTQNGTCGNNAGACICTGGKELGEPSPDSVAGGPSPNFITACEGRAVCGGPCLENTPYPGVCSKAPDGACLCVGTEKDKLGLPSTTSQPGLTSGSDCGPLRWSDTARRAGSPIAGPDGVGGYLNPPTWGAKGEAEGALHGLIRAEFEKNGRDINAAVSKYAYLVSCGGGSNKCTSGKCNLVPSVFGGNDAIGLECRCGGSSSGGGVSTPLAPVGGSDSASKGGASQPVTPVSPPTSPDANGGKGFDPEEEAIAPLAPAAQPPAAPKPVGVGVLYSINSFVQTIGNALDPFRFFANESPALQVVQDDSCRIKGDQLGKLGLTSKQDGENKVYYFNGEKFYTKTKDGKITDRSLEVEKKYNEAYKSFCGAKACGTGGKCQQGSDGLCNVCAEPEEEAPAPQLPAAPDGKAPAGGKAGEPEAVPFNFLAWQLSSESCLKYSAENIKQAVEAYLAEHPEKKNACGGSLDEMPAWERMIYPWVADPSCLADSVEVAKAKTCSSNRCEQNGTVCKLNAEISGCECVSEKKAPEAPTYGAPGVSSKPPSTTPAKPVTPQNPTPTTKTTLDNCQLTSAAAGFSFPKEGENAGKIMFTDSAGKTTTIMDKAAFAALSKEAQKKVMENTKTSTGKSVADAANEAGKAVCEANSCKANSATRCVFDPKKENLTDRCYCPTKTAPPAPAAAPAAPATGGSGGGSKPPAPVPPPGLSSPTTCTYTYKVEVYSRLSVNRQGVWDCSGCYYLLDGDHSGNTLKAKLAETTLAGAEGRVSVEVYNNDDPAIKASMRSWSSHCGSLPIVKISQIGNPSSCPVKGPVVKCPASQTSVADAIKSLKP